MKASVARPITWLKRGFTGFGSPAGQIAFMHNELVERRRWISERRFLHALNDCMLLPGPQAQQLATCIGLLILVEATHGKLGFTALLSAISAAVVGLILKLALFFAFHVRWPQGSGGRFDGLPAAMVAAAAIALFRFKVGVSPSLSACAAAGLGFSWLLASLQ